MVAVSFLTHQDARAEDLHQNLLHDGFRVRTEEGTEKGSEGKHALWGASGMALSPDICPWMAMQT